MADFNYLVHEPMPGNRTIPCTVTLTDDFIYLVLNLTFQI
jgi:hypothetical protein